MSQKTLNATFTLLLCLGLTIPMAGCKSIGFDKPSLPSLAFWKKDGDSELPPPPARSFDPSRFESEDGQTEVARSKDMYDEYGLKREPSEFATTKDALARKSPRKAYGMEDFASDTNDAIDNAANSFDLNANKLKNKFADTANKAEAGLSDAQQKFRDAMKSTSPSNSFTSDDNSFAAKPVGKSPSSFGGFGASSATNSFAATANSFDAKVDNSLSSLDSKLRSAASDLKNQARNTIQSPANSQLKSDFEKRLANARAAAKNGTDRANQQLEALADVSAQTRDAISKPFAKMGSNGFSMPTAQQPGLTPNPPSDSFQLAKPNQLASTKNLANDTVNVMRSEIEEARRQIELLKQQVAATKAAASDKASSVAGQAEQALTAGANQFRNQVANTTGAIQNAAQGFSLPLDNARAPSSFGESPRVANQNNQFGSGTSNTFSPNSTASPATNNRTLQPQDSGNSSGGSFYPSTPYGGFSSNQKSLVPAPNHSAIGQVGFDSATSQASDIHQADRIDSASSHVPNVRIPASLMTGKSSFAPGSTTSFKQ